MTLESSFITMPLEELITPKGGRLCIVNHWWLFTEKAEALFYRTYDSPQCNTNRNIVERLGHPGFTNTRIVFIALAFVPHRCSHET